MSLKSSDMRKNPCVGFKFVYFPKQQNPKNPKSLKSKTLSPKLKP